MKDPPKIEKCERLEWIKPSGFRSIAVLDSAVIAIHSSSYILFYPPHRPRVVYKAASKQYGRGVQCLAGCHDAPLFAFAEKGVSKPRILIKTFPAFEPIATLCDQKLGEYSFLEFTEHECLVALKGLPSYEIQLWSWRSARKMMFKKTGVIQDQQLLRVHGSSGGQISVAQLVPGSSGGLLWEFTKCYDRCVLHRKQLKAGDESVSEIFVDLCWTADNLVILLNDQCNLFKIDEDEKLLQLITQHDSVQGPHTAHMLTHKQGIVLFCSNGNIQLWHTERRGTKSLIEVWTKTSELIQSEHIIAMSALYPADPELIIGWSQQGCLVTVNVAEGSVSPLQEFGCGFTSLALLAPDEKHLVTLNCRQELQVWLMLTGNLIGKLELGTEVGDRLYPNPLQPYISLLEQPGFFLLVDCRQPASPNLAFRISLCREPLDELQFSVDGAAIVAVNYEQGLVLQIDSDFSHLTPIYTQHRILSVCMERSQYLFVLVQDSLNDPGGKHIHHYSMIDSSLVQILRCPQYLKEICAVPGMSQLMATLPHSRLVLFCRYVKYDKDLKVCKLLSSGQHLRQFRARIVGDQIVCFGRDGQVSLLAMTNGALLCSQVEHHWRDRGVKEVVLSKHGHLVSLGHSQTLICSLMKPPPGPATPDLQEAHSPSHHRPLPSQLSRLQARLTTYDHSWLEVSQQERQSVEQTGNRQKIEEVKRDFRIVQLKVQALLDANLKGPADERIDIIEFDINLERRTRILNAARDACETYRVTHETLIETWDRMRELIVRLCWDQMTVKTRAALGIDKSNLKVEKYGFAQPHERDTALYSRLMERKAFNSQITTKAFHPWYLMALESSEEAATPDILTYEKPTVRVGHLLETASNTQEWFGSISHRFLTVDGYHEDQFNVWTSELVAKDESILLKKLVENLRLHFNEKFDQLFREKEQTLDLIRQHLSRLREIQQDLVWPCHSSYPELKRSLVEWTPEEQVEMILEVRDEELPVGPYISPSEQELIAHRLAEEERLRQLAALDNFKERALMEMMDGVLELRWEDKLKKDVPKPPCMTKKSSDQWNEQDLNSVKDYEYRVEQMTRDRAKYKVMLLEEWEKSVKNLEGSIKNFDDNLFNLYCTKLKVDQAINQEQLKILRINSHSKESYTMDMEYIQLEETLTYLEQQELPVAVSVVNQLQTTLTECRTNYEAFVSKDKAMDKKFKAQLKNEYSNVLSKPQLDQMYKLYRKMPKLKIISCSDFWLEIAEHVVNPQASSYLPADAQDVIRGVDLLDKQTFQMSNIDLKVVDFVVRNRRLKIESDFKMKATGLELAEAEATVQLQTRAVSSLRERIAQLRTRMNRLLVQQNELEQDVVIQLNLTQGQVELDLTGHMDDFLRVHLITKRVMHGINTKVIRAGAMTVSESQASSHVKKMIAAQECLQRRLKMSIDDLNVHIKRTERTKISREILAFLRDEEKGCVAKDTWLAKTDRDAEAMVAYYKAENDSLDRKLNAISEKKIKILDSTKEINNLAEEMSISVSLVRMQKDEDFEEQYEQSRKNRMKALLTRCTLLQKIQKKYLHLQMLKSELSTLRCKTYPVLKPQP